MYWPDGPCGNGHNAPRYKAGNRHCVECKKIYCRNWRLANAQHELAKAKEWRDRNREFLQKRDRLRYHSSPSKRERDKKWKKENPHVFAALQVKREAAKKQRTPTWADHAAMRAIYKQAAKLTRETGILHHVDHIVPLLGKDVCGLHVPNNLRVVTADENMRKKNKWSAESDQLLSLA